MRTKDNKPLWARDWKTAEEILKTALHQCQERILSECSEAAKKPGWELRVQQLVGKKQVIEYLVASFDESLQEDEPKTLQADSLSKAVYHTTLLRNKDKEKEK